MFEYKLDAPPVAVTVSTPAARAAPGEHERRQRQG
jgi:hypothetical protein